MDEQEQKALQAQMQTLLATLKALNLEILDKTATQPELRKLFVKHIECVEQLILLQK